MYVDVTSGMRGFFAVLLWWNDEDGPERGFWEPWSTSPLSFETREGAERDGRRWAEAEGLPFGAPPEVVKSRC